MRLGFDPRVGKIPWRRRAWQPTPVFMSKPAPVFMSKPAPVFMSKPTPVFMSKPTPVFMSGESHGQRDLEGYSPRGRQESDVTEQLTLGSSVCVCVCVCVCACTRVQLCPTLCKSLRLWAAAQRWSVMHQLREKWRPYPDESLIISIPKPTEMVSSGLPPHCKVYDVQTGLQGSSQL